MLTKDLLNFKHKAGKILPQFIDCENTELLDLATSLLTIYNLENGNTKSEIDVQSSAIINAAKNVLQAKGLNKIIQDRCEWSQQNDLDLKKIRAEIFSLSSQFFSQKEIPLSPENLNSFIKEKNPELPKDISEFIYLDLPENATLIKRKIDFPKELLTRYNLSLAQSLLLYASDITVKLKKIDVEKIRKVFKYLKFFQLLTQIQKQEDGIILLKIDGPLNILEQSSRYGLRLASFFPALCDLPEWEMQTNVSIKNKKYQLILNQKNGLKSFYRNFSAYLPEEVKVFHRLFKEKVEEWDIIGETPFIEVMPQFFIFPDLCFKHKITGDIFYLELFHRWHIWQLKAQLNSVLQQQNLIIGVDRTIMKNLEIKSIIENLQENDNKQLFLFSDFPAFSIVEKVLKENFKLKKC